MSLAGTSVQTRQGNFRRLLCESIDCIILLDHRIVITILHELFAILLIIHTFITYRLQYTQRVKLSMLAKILNIVVALLHRVLYTDCQANCPVVRIGLGPLTPLPASECCSPLWVQWGRHIH